MDEIVQFDFPTDSPKIIKVIGVGGGGGNAVNHMYREGIHDVTFVLCNTDNQALAESPVPVKLQLGRSITQGLGAGNRPERARDAAEESIEDIRNQLNDGTKMVFITAGMGGGTGTGAARMIVILAVITMNAILGTVQTVKASASLDSLKQMSAPTAKASASALNKAGSSTTPLPIMFTLFP